jgi:hypothetical protein
MPCWTSAASGARAEKAAAASSATPMDNPNPVVPEYVELNSRLAWHATEQLEFALSGFNLLHGKHVEYAPGDAIPRSVYIETRFRF